MSIEVNEVTTFVVVQEDAGTSVVQVGLIGPQGAKGDTGDAGGQPVPVSQVFAIPVTSWTMSHSFAYYPDAITWDVDGNVIEGDISYPDGTHVTVTWAGEQTGTMELM